MTSGDESPICIPPPTIYHARKAFHQHLEEALALGLLLYHDSISILSPLTCGRGKKRKWALVTTPTSCMCFYMVGWIAQTATMGTLSLLPTTAPSQFETFPIYHDIYGYTQPKQSATVILALSVNNEWQLSKAGRRLRRYLRIRYS